jgi:lysophospholipase L1-like esterase
MRAGRIVAAIALGLAAGLAPAVVPAPGPGTTPRAAASTVDEPSHPLRWLALGDSYSSGEGVDENYGDCAQSPGAYAAEAFNLLRLEGFPVDEQEFLACSGAEVPDAGESVDLVEQLDQATGRYDLVTLTIGGNDAGFGDALKQCLGPLGCASEDELQRQIDAVRPKLFAAYGRIVDELLAPGGHVVVLGYPRIFEPSDEWHWSAIDSCELVWPGDADMIRRLSDRLNSLIRDVAGAYDNVHYLDVADAFEGHNLCAGWRTTNEWINGLSIGWDTNRFPRLMHSFHPNREGHAAEAAMLADLVRELDWSELSTPEQRFTWWMRIGWTNAEVQQGYSDDGPLKELYVGWIRGRAEIDGDGNVTGTAELDVLQNLVCTGPGLIDVQAQQTATLSGSVLPGSSSPLGPDLDLTIGFGPATVGAETSGCANGTTSAAYFTDALRGFLDGLEPVHVQVRARQAEDRYGFRYDQVPVSLNGQEFFLTIE